MLWNLEGPSYFDFFSHPTCFASSMSNHVVMKSIPLLSRTTVRSDKKSFGKSNQSNPFIFHPRNSNMKARVEAIKASISEYDAHSRLRSCRFVYIFYPRARHEQDWLRYLCCCWLLVMPHALFHRAQCKRAFLFVSVCFGFARCRRLLLASCCF